MSNDHNKTTGLSTYGDRNVPSGMLSSPHIAYCVKKYNIIENYDKSCLRSATYDMRIGGSVLTWENGNKIEYELGEVADINKNILTKVELRPNSLTFVTTIEKFNLPKDIIARFNLKSKLVHEGLLLGTGPIVDPELKANLLIPLHNFSGQDITLHYGDEFISVEFTKTLNPDDKLTIGHERFEYVKNRNSLFDFHKYRKRIGGKKVESSVLSTLYKFEETISIYKKRLAYVTWGGLLAVLATVVGLITLVITTWSLISSSFNTYQDASNIVKQNKEQNIDFRAFALKSTLNDQQKEIESLKKQLSILNIRMMSPPRYITNSEIRDIQMKIVALERRLYAISNRINKDRGVAHE